MKKLFHPGNCSFIALSGPYSAGLLFNAHLNLNVLLNERGLAVLPGAPVSYSFNERNDTGRYT